MTQAIRQQLEPIEEEETSHAGLLLSRYLTAHKPSSSEERNRLEQTPEERLINKAMEVSAGEEYKWAFKRWKENLEPLDDVQTCTLELASSLAIGLGNENPLEVGLTVHHTYGMPMIPGSALKGLCRRGADLLRKEGKVSDRQFYALFGSTKDNGGKDSAGCVTFYDALYDPDSVEGKPFHRDVITVHHQEYYGSKGETAPTDFDDPTPVPFLVVKKGAKFFFTIQAPSKEWGEFTLQLLKWCLTNLGVGGKTNAGYGYFKVDGQPGAAQTTQGATTQQTAPIATASEKWENVTVRLDPGSGEMSAQYEGRRAFAGRPAAQELQNQLPEEVRNRLQNQRRIQADIEVEVTGRKITIVKIIHRG